MFYQLLTPIAAASTQQAPAWLQLLPMVLIFVIFYVIWFLPLRKKQMALEQVINDLKKGDKVVTNGGFYGEVVKVEEGIVVLKLAENVKVRVAKRAIGGLAGSAEDNGGN
jgi:preprotein translocase subunit YajC